MAAVRAGPTPAHFVYMGGSGLGMHDFDIGLTLIAQYGWAAFLLVYFIKEVVPAAINYFNKTKEQESDAKNAETVHRRDLETRQVAAMEKIAESTEANTALTASIRAHIEQTNTRMAHLERESAVILSGIEILLDRKTTKRGRPGSTSHGPAESPASD